jgi:uncharacterized protein (TIGR00288 family)
MDTRVAMFIDADNLLIEAQKSGLPFDVQRLSERIREEGRLVLARAYADWRTDPASRFVGLLQDNTVEMVMLPTSYHGKNTADIQIVVDALELTILPNSPEIIALVAGDRDFVPLVQRIKRYGKTVIGIGLRGSTSRTLERACTRFVYYEDMFPELSEVERVNLMAPATAQESNELKVPEDKLLSAAFELLVKAAYALRRQEKPATGALLKPMMLQLDPGFTLQPFGYISLSAFVDAADEHHYVRKSPAPGGIDFQVEPLKAEHGQTQESAKQQQADTPLDGSDPREILRSYRAILQQKNVPLLAWYERKLMIEGLHETMKEAGDPATLPEMQWIMADYAARQMLRIPDTALYKLAYTMKVAGLLRPLDSNFGGPGDRFYLGDEPERLLESINAAYLVGIKHNSSVPFNTTAVALLLFEETSEDALKRADDAIYLAGEQIHNRLTR